MENITICLYLPLEGFMTEEGYNSIVRICIWLPERFRWSDSMEVKEIRWRDKKV